MTTISRAQARHHLVGALGLRAAAAETGVAGARHTLHALRCIQLDPLDPLGTNLDLVLLARVDGLSRGEAHAALLAGHAFEHFAKERCLLPASAFPYYRDQAAETPWWRLGERLQRLPHGIVERVLDEVRARGPLCAADVDHHGAVEPLDWSGWKGTSRAATMALEVLWTRCQVVVCGLRGRRKLFDVPERALPAFAHAAGGEFERWALQERVAAAGLLARAGGATWSMLREAQRGALPERLVAEGRLEALRIEGSSRTYLAPAGFREVRFPDDDGRMRLLGPLDPLLWDRSLVRHVFDFSYTWEVYKPAAERRYGWYVCPLLHRGALVGRLEGRLVETARGTRILRVERIWREPGADFDEDALDAALHRHAAACGAQGVRRPARRRRPGANATRSRR